MKALSLSEFSWKIHLQSTSIELCTVAGGKYDFNEQTKIEFQFAVLQHTFISHQLSGLSVDQPFLPENVLPYYQTPYPPRL